ncbi:hypothetical protein CkaCkLH20_04231 [Colletotrichum karsti]|uniref:Uncharacterized protein n=1 Tax=Colletotrichum karsti TaxID=1095194 RepID=A0A9P6I895_9PEZI|nr:uncharacterized protein CkaCkLH20_04231 [Colletotrichum karsti]KAF9878193.1 hypothetical protein CkaCkLH20_04231 [Colletotrichum karsti]
MAKTQIKAQKSSDTVADSPQLSRIESLPKQIIHHIIDFILARGDTDVACDLASFAKSSPVLFALFCAYLRAEDACRPLSQVFFIQCQKKGASCDEVRAEWWDFWARFRRVCDMVYTSSEGPSLLGELGTKVTAANLGHPRRLMRSLLIFSSITGDAPAGQDRKPKHTASRDISDRLTKPEVNDHQTLWDCVSFFHLDQIKHHKVLQSIELPQQRGIPGRAVAVIACKRYLRSLMLRGLSFLDEYLRAVPEVRRSMLIESFGPREKAMNNPSLPKWVQETESVVEEVCRMAGAWT